MEQRMIVTTRIAAMGGALALVLFAAGHRDALANATIDVKLSDHGMESMGMQLSATEAKSGNITFEISSTSEELVHEFVVVRSDLADDAVAYTDSQDNEVDEAKMNVIGEAEDIEPGKTKTLTLNLEPGKYILMCNEAGHYKVGMHTDLVVTP
jgi:uncharacterized cupredoxin-like copper-binding protein